MPISIDRFEDDEADLEGPTNAERILQFLLERDDEAFTRSEIAAETGVTRNSVGPVLSRLKDRGLVRHRGEYWAITDDEERLQSATTYELVTRSLNELYGEEDPAEWIERMPDDADRSNDGS